jgi:ABC-type sugar transport system ATPase subunit
MSDLLIKDLRSRVPGLAVQALEAFDLSLRGAEIVVMNGPSGSGKSLLLRAIADLEKPMNGEKGYVTCRLRVHGGLKQWLNISLTVTLSV